MAASVDRIAEEPSEANLVLLEIGMVLFVTNRGIANPASRSLVFMKK